ncbi:MAG TPA: type VI secretion system baseplate subunit TssK [Bryobacteraceae bacterium]|nr:type VI secretion system baseplate subunit TssK [Bryobacteraceae bacterium]
MQNRNRVVWNKGMFLNPQQFQTQDQFVESALHFRFTASHFANWGVSDLTIDADSLTNGVFRVSQCVGVMPDGEPFDMPGADDLVPSRKFAELFSPTQEALDVYLALPELRPRSRNVTIPGSQTEGSQGPAATRYVAETLMVPDENIGAEEKPVMVARRTFRLLFGNEYRDGFVTLRIARISRSAVGALQLSPEFVPPCLNLGSSPYLDMLLRRQVEILANKSASLSGPRRQRGKITAEFLPSETANFWLLHTVNTHLPELRHIWKVRRGHPEAAYACMLRLAGALATFSLEARPENLPDYDHDDLGRCFTLLDRNIRDLMETVIPSKFVAIPLEFRDRFIWGGTVTEDQYFKNSQLYLAVSAKIGMDDIIRKVPQIVKVASQDDIQRLVRSALPGLALRHVPVPPAAIPVRLDNQYFLLNQSGPLWDSIKLSRQIAVYAPGEIVEPRMEAVIVLE